MFLKNNPVIIFCFLSILFSSCSYNFAPPAMQITEYHSDSLQQYYDSIFNTNITINCTLYIDISESTLKSF